MAAGEACSFDGRLKDVRAAVDGVLADRDATLLHLKRHLARELSFDPKPQALQALSALREIEDPKSKEIGTRAAILHLAIDRSTFELWDSPDTSDAALDRGLAMIEPLCALKADEEKALEATIAEVDRMQRDAIGRICASLVLPEEPLLAALVVVPEIARLAADARNGHLAESTPSLTHEEREAILSATSPAASSHSDRVLLDAIALRTAMENAIGAYLEAMGAGADGQAASREILESLQRAHAVVSPRLDAVRAAQFAKTKKGDRRVDDVRRRLFAAYLQLKMALAGHPTEIEAGIQEQIEDAERAGAAVDQQNSAREGLMRDAAAGVGAAAAPAAAAEAVAFDMQTVVRERRRKRLLIGIAAALVPLTLIVNFVPFGKRSAAPASATDFVASAVPVQQVFPIGQALYCQVTALLWQDLTDTERAAKVTALGKLAAQRGYGAITVVDENRRELARWSAQKGAEAGAGLAQSPE